MNDRSVEPGMEPRAPAQLRAASLTEATAKHAITALSEPRSFLLFIFAIMAMVEFSSYIKTTILVETMVAVANSSAQTIIREQDFNKGMMEGLLRVIEQAQRDNSYNPKPAPNQPR